MNDLLLLNGFLEGFLRSCVLGEGLRSTHELPAVPGR